MARIEYVAALEQLRLEGYSRDDIEGAFLSLSESGMQANDEDGPLANDELTIEEFDVVRRQLASGNDEPANAALD